LETPRDFAGLFGLNYRQLSGIIYSSEPKYFSFSIPKASGGTRRITAPKKRLKTLQRRLNYVLQCVYEPKAAVHGFVPQRSTVTNAEAHTGAELVLNLDLKGFFPSINFGRIRGLLSSYPYGLPENVATVVAQTCTFNDVLAQGAPTSPTIANMICGVLDSRLTSLAEECRAIYTRYADDITFSTTQHQMPNRLVEETRTESASPMDVTLGNQLTGIIRKNGFAVNQEKVRLQRSTERQEVTGLVVNEFVNVPRELVRQVRAMLHAWRKFGLANAHDHHVRKYYGSEETTDNSVSSDVEDEGKSESSQDDSTAIPRFENVVRGRIEYIGMVRGKDNSIYKKYRSQYDELAQRDLSESSQLSDSHDYREKSADYSS
jgi:RNA-directed DNA polymerase